MAGRDARRGRTSPRSAALELAYFALLAAVYARADYSFAYPVARGSAPVLVLLICVIALGAPVSLAAAVGVLAVTGGVLLVRGVGSAAADAASLVARARRRRLHRRLHARRRPRHPPRRRDPVLRARPRRLRAIPYAAAIVGPRGTAALGPPSTGARAAAGVGMVAAYLLVLAALERAEAAPVAALRETSVVMAAAGAAIAGREKVPPARLARRRAGRGRRRRPRPRLAKRRLRCQAPRWQSRLEQADGRTAT